MKLGTLTLSKSMVEILIAVINGNQNLPSLQKKFSASKSWISRVINSLEKQEFVKKIQNGKLLTIESAMTPHGIAFRNMYLEKPYKKYSEIFSGKNLEVLQAIVTGEKSTRTIGDMMNVQARIIRPRIKFLASNGLIKKKGKRYTISNTQEKAIIFIQSIRNFSKKEGIILWKFGKNTLLQTNKNSPKNGILSGFNKYDTFGIKINTINFIYYTGTKKLSIENIFIHSLFEINDQRTFAFAITLYAKKKLYLKKERILQLAEKFGKLKEVNEIKTIFEKIKNKNLEKLNVNSLVDIKEIKRMFELYEVKNV